MDNFEKMLKMTIGFNEKTPAPSSLEVQVAAAKEELEEKKARLMKLESELEAKRKADEEKAEAASAEREIIVRYTPNKPGSARVVKGAEPMEEGKPDNVVGLIDAAAGLMGDMEGVNRNILAAAMLDALMKGIEFEALVKEVMKHVS